MAYNKKSTDQNAVQRLKKDLADGNIGTLYVFYGEEGYLKRHYLNQLKELCGGPFADFNIITLDGEQVNVQSLTDAVDSIPMGSDKKLVIIRDYKLMQPTGDMKEFLPELLTTLPEYICLVFSFDEATVEAEVPFIWAAYGFGEVPADLYCGRLNKPADIFQYIAR